LEKNGKIRRKMPKKTTGTKREIKLEKLLYREYLRKTYVVYNYKHNHMTIKRKTDYTYGKWRAELFKNQEQ
jgi:hypothetical protein